MRIACDGVVTRTPRDVLDTQSRSAQRFINRTSGIATDVAFGGRAIQCGRDPVAGVREGATSWVVEKVGSNGFPHDTALNKGAASQHFVTVAHFAALCSAVQVDLSDPQFSKRLEFGCRLGSFFDAVVVDICPAFTIVVGIYPHSQAGPGRVLAVKNTVVVAGRANGAVSGV